MLSLSILYAKAVCAPAVSEAKAGFIMNLATS